MTHSPEPETFRYQADELELFAHAERWKAYWFSRIKPFLGDDVLEVGAGLGANTRIVRSAVKGRYLCLEPDGRLLQKLKLNVKSAAPVETLTGVVASLSASEQFDTAIYIDVLEHIEDDQRELSLVAEHVRPGGHVIVLSPAYGFLYSPFDQAIGHYRRYNRSSLLRCTPPDSSTIRVECLDFVGAALSLSNRLFLRQKYPTLGQILFWDRVIVPVSRVIDRVAGFCFGRTILAIWQMSA